MQIGITPVMAHIRHWSILVGTWRLLTCSARQTRAMILSSVLLNEPFLPAKILTRSSKVQLKLYFPYNFSTNSSFIFILFLYFKLCLCDSIPSHPSSAGPAACAGSVEPPPNINQLPLPSPCHRLSNRPQSCSAKHQPPTHFHAIPLLDVCFIHRHTEGFLFADTGTGSCHAGDGLFIGSG